MILSTTVVVSVLSLFSFATAATIDVKREVQQRDGPPPTSSDWYPHTPPTTSSWYPHSSPASSGYPVPPSSPPYPPQPSNPPTQEPCPFRCLQRDLANNPLTDEAFRGLFFFCSYQASKCDNCSFCKYNSKTGLLLEDNDDGNCPKKADTFLPWERRSA